MLLEMGTFHRRGVNVTVNDVAMTTNSGARFPLRDEARDEGAIYSALRCAV